jgi:hypothetical protein
MAANGAGLSDVAWKHSKAYRDLVDECDSASTAIDLSQWSQKCILLVEHLCTHQSLHNVVMSPAEINEALRFLMCYAFDKPLQLTAGAVLFSKLAALDDQGLRGLFSVTDHGFSKLELERNEIEKTWFRHASATSAEDAGGEPAAAAAAAASSEVDGDAI